MRQKDRRPLTLEPLEPRTLLSGNVTAVVSNGNLVITGDAGNNHFEVQQTAPGEFEIARLDADTNINNGASATLGNVAKNVIINTGDGNDMIFVHDANLPRKLTVNAGGGMDQVAIADATIRGGWKVTGTDDNDVVAADVNVAGNTLIDLKGQGSDVHFYTTLNRPTNNTFEGSVTIRTEGGPKTLFVNNTTVIGKMTVSAVGGLNDIRLHGTVVGGAVNVVGGDGNDMVDFTDVLFASTVKVVMGDGDNEMELTASDAANPSRIGGNLVVSGGDGLDDVEIKDTRLGGSATINLGTADSSTTIKDTHVAGSVNVVGFGGNDGVELRDVTIDGSVTASLGYGLDGLSMNIDDSPICYVGGSVTLRCTGFPWSQGSLDLRATIVGGSVRGLFGAGSNTTTLENATIQRDLFLTGGDQDDSATVTGTSIAGKATLRLGDGGNHVTIQPSGPVLSRIDGDLSIATTGGNDTVDLTGTIIGGNATIAWGNGDNDGTWATVVVGGSLTVRGGNGADDLQIKDYAIGRNATTSFAGGTNSTLLSSSVGGVSTIGGSLAVLGGDGSDAAGVSALETGRDVRIVLGNGSNNSAVQNSTILGRLTYGGGGADDTIGVYSSHIARQATVATGGGTDTCHFHDTQVAAGWMCDTGADNDVVEILECELHGPVRVRTASGNDTVKVWFDSHIHGLLDIRTSSGNDEVTVADVLVGGRFFVDAGDGNDSMLFARQGSSAEAIVEGIATVRMGRGDDFMGIGLFSDANVFGHFRAPALLDGGPGNDGLNYLFNGNLFDDGRNEVNWETVT